MSTAIRRFLPSALIAAVLTLTACGGSTAQPPAPEAAPTTGATAAPGGTGPDATGGARPATPPTLDFTARTLDDQPFAGSSLAGKPAVLWFWAAWCTRCRGVADEVAAVARDNAARVNLVGVAGLGSGADAMRRFARDTGIEGFPNLADDDGAVWRRFGVTSQEQYVLLDSAGKVVHSGPLSQDELRRRVAKLT
ncbi:redoxin domain-containing protein [Micromonospora psammae]|uniref:redoxin domain-containing protein n=1 Tax=Micromonospora sp. CPCC 205556 TaxID=3122398 RepID=UPI002FF01DF7